MHKQNVQPVYLLTLPFQMIWASDMFNSVLQQRSVAFSIQTWTIRIAYTNSSISTVNTNKPCILLVFFQDKQYDSEYSDLILQVQRYYFRWPGCLVCAIMLFVDIIVFPIYVYMHDINVHIVQRSVTCIADLFWTCQLNLKASGTFKIKMPKVQRVFLRIL